MTVTSGLIGVMLAWRSGFFSWPLSILVVLGLLLAHAANNVLNDLMDFRSGVDTADYHRVKYAPHPIHAGWLTARAMFLVFIALSFADLVILVILTGARGLPVAGFALAGFLISVAYVGGKFSLKFLGLGEAAVFVVWGPLMIGGTYWVMAGSIPSRILWASIPYALLVTTVILGKHIDKLEADKSKGIKTLPVLLGAKNALALIYSLMGLFYLILLCESVLNILPAASLLALFSLPRAFLVWKTLRQPKPAEAPKDWPIWPLWYVGWCFHLVRLAGGLMLMGFFGQVILERFFR